MTDDRSELLQGTLEMLVLRVLDLEPMHGWGIAQRLEQMSGEVFLVNQGSLYPALQRMKRKGWVKSAWGTTENNRRAKYYEITNAGAKQLERERADWRRTSAAVNGILEWAGRFASVVLFAILLGGPPSGSLAAQQPGAAIEEVAGVGDASVVGEVASVSRVPSDEGSYSVRDESLRVLPGAHVPGRIQSRSGDVMIGESARVSRISTRSGSIRIGAEATTGSLSTRGGHIQVGENSRVSGDIGTRHGHITLSSGASVVGSITTREGALSLGDGSLIDGHLRTRTGPVRMRGATIAFDLDSEGADIDLRDGSVVRGNLVVLLQPDCGLSDWFSGCFSDPRIPLVRIDSTSRIEGRLILDERTRIEIQDGAEVPEIEWYSSRADWAGGF